MGCPKTDVYISVSMKSGFIERGWARKIRLQQDSTLFA